LRVVIVDSDHQSFDTERAVAAAHGVELEKAQALSEDEVVRASRDADAIIVQYAPITRAVLEQLPSLRVVGRYGVGVDTIDVEAATQLGIAVTHVPDYGTEDVSDHAIALALTAMRATARLDRAMRRGERDLEPVMPLHRFRGRVFGVLGMGAIGRATAAKAAALGFRTIGADPQFSPGTNVEGVEVTDTDDLVARADVLSLHVPLSPATHHLVDRDLLARMRPGSVLVNTCRGGVVDTDALVEALADGRIGGACLDVFEGEHLPDGHPLLEAEDVVLTPHVAWYSEESYVELKRRITENVVAWLEHGDVTHLVNPAVRGVLTTEHAR
jgi:D-3-phosphoglycerate dehydrogenase